MAKKDLGALHAIAEHLVFTKEKVIAYYVLNPTRYDFVNDNQRLADLSKMSNMLSALSSLVDGKKQDMELYVVKNPINFNEWARGLEDATRNMNGGELPDNFYRGLKPNFEHVKDNEYTRSHAYLGVTLGDRRAINTSALTGNPFSQAMDISTHFVKTKIIGVRDQEVKDKEIDVWLDKARIFNETMERFSARCAKGSEIAGLYRRQLFPAMSIPQIEEYNRWGAGDIFYLSESEIEKHPKYNKITQPGGNVGYQATLVYQKFPDRITYPTNSPPWIIMVPYYSIPAGKYSFWSKFSIVSARQVKKDMTMIVKKAKDEELDANKAGQSPIAIEEKVALSESLEYYMSNSDEPWVFGDYFVTVTGETPKELDSNIQGIIQAYRSMGIILGYPTGIQYNLLKESFPGGDRVVNRYMQRQPVSIIGGGSPTINASVGD